MRTLLFVGLGVIAVVLILRRRQAVSIEGATSSILIRGTEADVPRVPFREGLQAAG